MNTSTSIRESEIASLHSMDRLKLIKLRGTKGVDWYYSSGSGRAVYWSREAYERLLAREKAEEKASDEKFAKDEPLLAAILGIGEPDQESPEPEEPIPEPAPAIPEPPKVMVIRGQPLGPTVMVVRGIPMTFDEAETLRQTAEMPVPQPIAAPWMRAKL